MLDNLTKRRIDTARDILVGKLPDPKSQVEQITIALIYKFMDDMDKQSEELGGKIKFFTGEYEKYSWSKIFDPRVSGYELVGLYGEAIQKMDHNPNIPPLFRNIFKNVNLPYRDPETLKMFLKVIGEFEYDYSEKLGDAFEYLLSIMGSQGDAGQFRTPRHIIDFMVKVIDPSKNETILDPACGTAGFLISSFNHIQNKNKKDGRINLTPDERARLIENLSGYDISPDMVRLSLVNMYLHGFQSPKIYEYDTLASEEKWNEFYDIILANPPFMSPKGGIKPHKRFSVQAKRSEVLFVDYIEEHLNPNGRAGVIVPEGIIFKSEIVYKKLRKMLIENLSGYDISPDMVRLSLVNMYLHGFQSPKIYEYDTLASEEKWNEFYDIILANPPFMSPNGGIKPHKRFSIQAKRSEVLFVDYIAEHLNPNGRGGVIVPEGIIFKSETAYKKLRKMLVENSLYAVVSLPAGVFNPYSGVKTSILFLNKNFAKKTANILFVKVNNDGFGLGAQRREIKENDLPLASEIINKYKQCIIEEKEIEFNLNETKLANIVKKEKIAESGDYNLSGDRYKETFIYNGKWGFVELGKICKIQKGDSIKKKNTKFGKIPVIAGGQQPAYYHNKFNREGNIITVSASGAYAGFVNYFEEPIFASDCSTIRSLDEEVNLTRFIYDVLKGKQENVYSFQKGAAQPHVYPKDLIGFKIPLPPLEIQEQIVTELDSYQKIIDGAKQVVENYKPTFKIDPEWEMMKLVKICDNLDGKRIPITKSDRKTGPFPYYGASGIVDYTENYIFDEDLLLISEDGANLLARVTPIAFSVSGKVWVNNHAHVLRFENIATQKYVELYVNSINIKNYVTGSAQPKLNQKNLNSIMIPCPHIEIQKNIVKKIESEQKIINSNKELITIFENKIKEKIAEVWGEQ